jgi:Reverse transcriptase (RNA-dependent DNA polymerase)
MSVVRVRAEAAYLLVAIEQEAPGGQGLETAVQTVEGLRWAFNWLVDRLTYIAEATAPRKKGNSGYQSPWWTERVELAVQEARRAEREAQAVPNEFNKSQLNQSLCKLSATVRTEKTKAWRATLQQATQKTELLWQLERWARLRSFRPPEAPRIPTLEGPTPGSPHLTTHSQKAQALAEKFFPNPPADLGDILDQGFQRSWEAKFQIQRTVTPDDVRQAVAKMSLWKAPGEDYLPVGFLKACGAPLFEVLAILATRCLQLGWFPERFKSAITVVLQKPNKPAKAYQTVGGYRPIALLPTLGKVIESIVASRISQTAEEQGLLPDGQMGNRANRSTELAIRLVVAQVYEAWRQKAAASLLQLDISAAFPTVNHIRLLATLREMGFPRWLVLWIKSWLQDRRTTLLFDGQSTPSIPVTVGIPQGSPLSPILFILYIASLYKMIKEKHPYISLVGFSDDTNLLAFGRDSKTTTRQLEQAWKTCLQWAATRGMAFGPEKSELIHFNKNRRQWQDPVNLALPGGRGSSLVKPVKSARFLGVWLD